MPPKHIYLVLVRRLVDIPDYPSLEMADEREHDPEDYEDEDEDEDDIDKVFKHSDTVFSIHRRLDSAHSTAGRIAHRLLRIVLRTNSYVQGDSWAEGERCYRGLFVENGEQIEVLVQKWPVEGTEDGDGGVLTEAWVLVEGVGGEDGMEEINGEGIGGVNQKREVLAVFGDVVMAEEYSGWMKERGASVVVEQWDVWK